MAKLTTKQWDKLKSRLDAGELAANLAREYGITRQAITNRFSLLEKETKLVANQIFEAEKSISESLHRLPPAMQIKACTLAQEMMDVSRHMASGARYSAMTYHKLAGMANIKAQKLDDEKPDPEELMTISALTKISNESAKVPIDLLKVNQTVVDAEKNKTLDVDHVIELSTDDWPTEHLIAISKAIPHDFDAGAS